MITIYTRTWNQNAAEFESSDAETAAMALINIGFEVRVLDLAAPNGTSGAECETEAENEAVLSI